MYVKRILAAFLITLLMLGSAFAATPEQAKAMVDKALAHVKAVGPEKAYADFNTPGNQFFDGELYIFAYDMQGKNLALGGNPKMTGKDLIDMKSADGKPLIRDLIEIIKTKGSGWYDYKWANPETKKIQDKTSYIKKIPGTEAFLGCGLYK
jgi:hypothetical protein